jgi:cardiolipin synthase
MADQPLPITLLQGAEEYFPALIRAIDSAQATIYLESYLIHDDPATQEVLESLKRARARGVLVYLVLDGFGAEEAMDWITPWCQICGISLEFYRPGVRWLAPKTWRRLHRKLVLIDDAVAFVGGINLIGDRSDHVHGTLPKARFDFAAQVTTYRVTAAISRTMRRLWWRVSLRNALRGTVGRLLDGDRRRAEIVRVREIWRRTRRHLRWRGPPVRKNASRRVRLLLRDNLRNRRRIEHWYLWRVMQARREVLIANAYFVPTYRFRQVLIDAARRGVRVRLLIQGTTDQWWTMWATKALIDELIDAGIEVYQYMPSFLHAKVAVIDDAMTVGSSNMDPFSLILSLEANLVAEEPLVAAELRSRLELAIGESVVRSRSNQVRRGPLRAMLRRIALTFALTALRIFIAFSGTRIRFFSH